MRKHHKPEHPSLNLLSYFSTPNPWQNRGKRRPSFSFIGTHECSVPNKPYSRGCCCSWMAFHSVLDTWHVSSWCHWWMDSKKQWLKQTKRKISWNQQERRSYLCLVSSLIERDKRQLLASCWRFMFYVDWWVTSLWFAVLGGMEVLGSSLVWNSGLFFIKYLLILAYLYQYLYLSKKKGCFFSSRASFMSPFWVLQKHRIN